MKIILLGAPASGKGTQTKLLIDEFKVPHISTGNILRENIKNETKLGLEVKECIDGGRLVPDELIIEIAKDRLKKDDCKAGFILDGFPRTIPQAEALDEMLKELNVELDAVVNIEVPEEVLYDRITGRRTCLACGATFHVSSQKPKVDGICDSCGAELVQRADDTHEVFEKRLSEYNNLTAPLIGYYGEKGLLKNISYIQDVNEVYNEIKKVLGY